jgi:hypothetical protein
LITLHLQLTLIDLPLFPFFFSLSPGIAVGRPGLLLSIIFSLELFIRRNGLSFAFHLAIDFLPSNNTGN